MRAALIAVLASAASCARHDPPPAPARPTRGPALPPLLAELALPSAPAGVSDGDDRHGTSGAGLAALATAPTARFERIPPPPGAHPLVCDVVEIAGTIAATTAAAPIELDGAQIALWDPATLGWAVVLDWDRGGAPRVTHEVGGQGIARLAVIDGRLWATDADAPEFGGFGLSAAGFEDYVFVSEPGGRFGPLAADQRPPAGTRVVPWAFHTFDVIDYLGAIVVSGGSVDLEQRGGTRYPAGLFVGGRDDRELAPACFPGAGHPVGVVRATSLVRFGGRLYGGLQNNERRVRWDLIVLTGDPRDPATPPPVLARVTDEGGWLTRRFAVAGDRLYWLAGRPRGGAGAVFRSEPARATTGGGRGLRFERVALPAGAGEPHDLAIAGEVRWLLTSTGLWRASRDDQFVRIADAPPGDPFGRVDPFCSAPLAIALDGLWAGSTRDGALYRVVP